MTSDRKLKKLRDLKHLTIHDVHLTGVEHIWNVVHIMLPCYPWDAHPEGMSHVIPCAGSEHVAVLPVT
jgi:hypothetical protein